VSECVAIGEPNALERQSKYHRQVSMDSMVNKIFYVSVVGSLKGGHVACRTIRVPLQTLSVVMHGLHHQGMRVADVTGLMKARADVGATPQPASAQQNVEALPTPDANRSEPGQPKETKRVNQRTTWPPSRSKRT
jgi:hypothetical protein